MGLSATSIIDQHLWPGPSDGFHTAAIASAAAGLFKHLPLSTFSLMMEGRMNPSDVHFNLIEGSVGHCGDAVVVSPPEESVQS